MSEPVIAVVDENNVVVGEATRREVHIRGLWHRSSHCLVHDGEGRSYLSIRDDVVCPDMYDISLTEQVKGNESFAECVRRGLEQRFGIVTDDVAPLSDVVKAVDGHNGGGLYDGESIQDNRFMQAFGATYKGPITPDRRIYSGGTWVALDRLDAFIAENQDRCAPHFVKDWRSVRDKLMPHLTAGPSTITEQRPGS